VTRRFDEKTALLTGAASGMGRAIALRLAAEGADVFALDIDEDGLQATAETISAAGGSIHVHTTDVTSVDSCQRAVERCLEAFGRIDVLGNIAGVSWQRHVEDVEEKSWDAMFAVNVKGPFFLCQAALPHLLEARGNIVNIASNAGIMGMAYTVPYCATKGAVVQMTRALAMEFAKEPIRINAIAPGGTDTPMVQNFDMPDDVDLDLLRPGMGYRQMGTPEQIAALFAFVASDEAGNIHGSILSADSGLTAG
jgi:NAD(P)-dependent dehydrogenase (short-subunit alcohol dehydrogenase family)